MDTSTNRHVALISMTTIQFTASFAVFAAGFAAIIIQDYARRPRALSTVRPPRALRPRAQFRPLPLALATEHRGLEIRPIIERLRERNCLAA
jgi:hypothetical protein